MSKKVLFYLVLDLIGITLTAFIGKYLCKMSDAVTNPWVSNGISLIINYFLFIYILRYSRGERE